MKSKILFFLLVFTSMTLNAQSDFSGLWKKVSDLEKESLPQSGLQVINQIYQDALKEKDSPNVIKSLIYRIKYETAIDKDKLPGMILEMEKLTRENTNPIEQAMLYSLLADLYSQYYRADLYVINQRTPLPPHPDGEKNATSLEEWSAKLFIQTIADYTALSLAPAKELQNTDVLAYKAVLTEGGTSRSLRPTLYDFLVYRGIELLDDLAQNTHTQKYFAQTKLSDKKYFAPDKEFVRLDFPMNVYDFVPQIVKLYQNLLAFRLQQNNVQAVLMVDLDRLKFVRDNTQTEKTAYLEALTQLEQQYAGHDCCVEILYEEAAYYTDEMRIYETSTIGEQDEPMRKAWEICTEGIKKYPHYVRIGILQEKLNSLTHSSLEVLSTNTVYQGKDLELALHYRNFSNIVVQIYKIKLPVSVYSNNWERKGRYKKNGVLIDTKKFDLINEYPYLYSDTTIKIKVPELGNYEYVVSADGIEEPVNEQFSVSRLATLSREVNGKREFLVVDRLSGKPVEGAQIRFYKKSNSGLKLIKNETLSTDKSGLATTYNNKEAQFYQVCFGKDSSLIASPVPWVSSSPQKAENSRKALNLFTDRAIYRPGQTVYFKGIAYETGKDVSEVVPNQKYTLTLRDANGKETANKDFTSNEWGSVAGEFVLPQGTLNGNFTIQSNKDAGYISFRVEEYKRPTFDIQFDKNENTYRLGDEIKVNGKAQSFSGITLQEAKLQYRITRRNHWFFYRLWQEPMQVAQGEVFTKEDGSFEIAFAAERAFEDKERKNVVYTYIVEASITDTNGETQSSQTSVSIGDKSVYLRIEGLDGNIKKEHLLPVQINAFNLSGNPISAKGTYEIYSLKPKNASKLDLQADEWTQDKKILSADFESGKAISDSQLKLLPSGRYRLIVTELVYPGAASSSWEKDAGGEADFVLFSTKDKQPPVPVYEWLTVAKDTCFIGETAEIYYGSSAKEVYVLYEIFRNNKRISTSRFILNNEIRKIEIPFLQSYDDGITATFTFIKDEKVFTRDVEIYKRQADKRLNLKMEVFRDRLLPGQNEEWKIAVKDSARNPIVAELLAGMYDASLDKIYKRDWNFNPLLAVYLRTPRFNSGNDFHTGMAGMYAEMQDLHVPSFWFDRLNWFGWSIYNNLQLKLEGAVGGMYGSNSRAKMKVRGVTESDVNAADLQEVVVAGFGTQPKAMLTGSVAGIENASNDAGGENREEAVQIRQNFNETAFFYPQLKTNEAGETLISFTVPESNTTWKFRGLAHTKDLKYGQIIEQAIAQKQLMITPNIPRFMRQGDKITISSNISNLSETAVTGNISIECFDPNTSFSAIAIADGSKTFSVEAGKTTAVSWTFDVPSGIDLTALKIVARSKDFSDGEQHLIPVLPNRMLVTESLPLNIRGGQTKTFSFDKMAENNSPTLENYRMTLEFTSNPVWYAIQALPTLTAPQSDNVLSWFAAYYSNALAVRIAGSNPKIKSIIDRWTKEGGSKETLLSNLEKNQDLKAVLLEETPWVMAAQNETEQKQRLSLLFDLNRTSYLNAQAIEKLRSLQTEEGGWSWFKRMNADVSITQWLLYGMGELSKNGLSANSEIKQMQEKAVRFIDKQLKKHFDDFKKYNKNWEKTEYISTYELEYLLVRSYYKEIPLAEAQEAVQFYTSLTAKYWVKNTRLYDRAIAAIILQREGNAKTALSIVKSLREHASRKPELGMFWANNTTRTFAFQSATCIHTFIMEAFQEVGTTSEEMDDMKLWLLKQKQTQEWESVPATLSAVNILLRTGTDWLSSEGKANIQWGSKTIDTSKGVIGTGYIKETQGITSVSQAQLSDFRKITVAKEDAAPGWGALYWQYFEDLDKISAAKTELNVEKSLFTEKITATGKILSAITENNPLKVGDKVIVRLVVRTDRDMEYVHLKDMRASCFEPVEQLSGLRWAQAVSYYQTMKDASMNFYFNNLPKGTYVFEYPLYVTSKGDYSNGITTIQCLYAPEFVSHSRGERVRVE